MARLLIRNGRVISPADELDGQLDLLIEDGEIREIAPKLSGHAYETLDAGGQIVAPGFVDIHVHLREPGGEISETLETGLRAAVAGGFEVVLSCDLAVAADHAVFGIPEVTRGLLASAGGLVRLPKRLPLAVALELALTGEPMDAQRARALGIVNRVVPAGELLSSALGLAEVIAANAPLAVQTSKAVMRAAADTDEASAWQLNDEAAAIVTRSPDAREGALAFAEKRPPVWTGRTDA